MDLSFNDWKPLESFDSLEALKPGADVYIYDPTVEPPVFRALFRKVTRNPRRWNAIEGIVYAIAPEEKVEVIANRYRKSGKAPLPSFAPRNRVGFSRTFDLEHMHQIRDYDA